MVKDKESQATCELLLFDGVDCDEGVNDEKFYCNATALLKNKNEGALRCQTVKMRSTKTIYVKART